jgi:hypothetical protein
VSSDTPVAEPIPLSLAFEARPPASPSSAEPAVAAVSIEPPKTEHAEIQRLSDVPAPSPNPGEVSAHRISEPEANPPAKVEPPVLATSAKEVRREDETEIASEELKDTIEYRLEMAARRMRIAYLVGAGLVMGAILGALLALGPRRHLFTPEAPSQAKSQDTTDSTQFPAESSSLAESSPETQARQAFRQGRLLEANRYCDGMLQIDPSNSFALNLKQEIRERFSKLAQKAMTNQRWQEACVAWNNVLRVYAEDRDASRQLKISKANLEKQEQVAIASKIEADQKIQELHQKISLAIASNRYLPPSSGNALELIRQLEALSTDDAFGREKLDEISRELLAAANRNLQAKDSAAASTLVKQIQTYLPETPELKALREGIRAEEARLGEARISWLQKAEAAMAGGRYVTPANDNVLAHCNQLLLIDPQNPKAIDLKKQSSVKAAAHAKTLVREGAYDEARAIYSALLYVAQSESPLSLTGQELKAEIERLTFNAYAVIHDHAIGSCTGRLRFNGYQVSFVPSSDSNDGFAFKISELRQVEPGDKLKVHFKSKTYRFEPNAAKDARERRARIDEINHRLSALIANRNSF